MIKYLKTIKSDDIPNYAFFKKSFSDEIRMIDDKPVSTPFINKWRCVGKFDWIDETDKNRGQTSEKERDRSVEKEKKRSYSSKS